MTSSVESLRTVAGDVTSFGIDAELDGPGAGSRPGTGAPKPAASAAPLPPPGTAAAALATKPPVATAQPGIVTPPSTVGASALPPVGGVAAKSTPGVHPPPHVAHGPPNTGVVPPPPVSSAAFKGAAATAGGDFRPQLTDHLVGRQAADRLAVTAGVASNTGIAGSTQGQSTAVPSGPYRPASGTPGDGASLVQWAGAAPNLRAWGTFALAQRARHVPASALGRPMTLGAAPAGYKLRLAAARGVPVAPPPPGAPAAILEFRLSATLYDQKTASFFGCTATSLPVFVEVAPSATAGAVTVDLDLSGNDFYLWSRVRDPDAMVVVELIRTDRSASSGAVSSETALCWAALLLVPEAPLPRERTSRFKQGSSRYLLFPGLHPDKLPTVVTGCDLHFGLETAAQLSRAAHLLPEDFLLSYADLVPGVGRFDASGGLSRAVSRTLTSLANPVLLPASSLRLSELAVMLPPGLVESLMPRAGAAGVHFALRAAAHNGRRFVGARGGDALTAAAEDAPLVPLRYIPAHNVLEAPSRVTVTHVPVDALTALVLELVLIPGVVPGGTGPTPRPAVIGFTALVPFRGPAMDPASGPWRCELRGGPLRWLRDDPILDWQSLMTTAARANPAAVRLASARAQAAVHFTLAGDGPPTQPALEHAPMPTAVPTAAPVIPQVAMPVVVAPPPAVAGVITPVVGAAPPAAAHAATATVVVHPPPAAPVAALVAPPMAPTTAPAPLPALPPPPQITAGGELGAQLQGQLNALMAHLTALQQQQQAMQAAAMAAPAPAPAARPPTRAVDENVQTEDGGDGGRPHLAALAAMAVTAPVTTVASPPAAATAGVPGAPSRAALARLHQAGGGDALPSDVRALLRARPPAVVAPGSTASSPWDMAVEAADRRVISDLVVQLLGYRRADAFNGPEGLTSVYFTYQLFDLPPEATTRCALRPAEDGQGGLCVLDPAGMSPAAPALAPAAPGSAPGVLRKYRICGREDPNLGAELPSGAFDGGAVQDRRLALCRYLGSKVLHVDVFDGASQLQIGTAAVPLSGLLRQGRDFAELLLEVPVIDAKESLPEEAARARRRRGVIMTAAGPAAVAPISRGALLLRLLNLGRLAEDVGLEVTPITAASATHMASPARRKKVRVRPVAEAGGPIARALGQAPPGLKLAWTGGGMAAEAGGDAAMGAPPADAAAWLDAVERRKLARVLALRQLRSQHTGLHHAPDGPRELRAKTFADITGAREREHDSLVAAALRRATASERVIRPTYGEVAFFEHDFVNPFAGDAVFRVDVSDPDLRLVTSGAEWRALRAAAGLPAGGAEDDAFSGASFFLRPGEPLRLPFRYQTFRATAVAPGAAGAGAASAHPAIQVDTPAGPPPAPALSLEPRRVMASIVAESDGRLVAALELDVRPRAAVVDRVIRLAAPELDFLKQRIRLTVPTVPSALAAALAVDAATAAAGGDRPDVSVRCSDASAVVAAGSSAPGGAGPKDEVLLKLKVGPAGSGPHVLWVLVYADRYHARLAETWQVLITPMRRVDLAAAVGQTSHGAVVVRGAPGDRPRRVAVFCSHPDEVAAAPDAFSLVGGALGELALSFKPLAAGRLDAVLHLVDVESGAVVQALLIAADARSPTVSKTFEVELPLGAVSHKRISYTNPYPAPRSFYLRSTHPWLVAFKPERLDLPESETRHIGLTFTPGARRPAGPEPIEVLVFINDEEDKTEEVFRVRAYVL